MAEGYAPPSQTRAWQTAAWASQARRLGFTDDREIRRLCFFRWLMDHRYAVRGGARVVYRTAYDDPERPDG